LAAALSLPDVRSARYVLSTRHGELDRTVSLLNSIDSREPLSPADFSMSVHNSLIGLLSMAAGNRGGHTAVSAGSESFCFGLLEAVSCLCERPGQPVILVHQDEAPGAAFAELIPERDVLSPIAIAIAVTRRQQDGAMAMTMSTRPSDGSPATPDHAGRFLRFVLSGAGEAVSVGDRMIWEWHRV
jgi:hypothetical protein